MGIGSAAIQPQASAWGERMAEAAIPSVSIVMPCLNEEETVGICVTKAMGWLERTGTPGEVLVVDNGSTDRSAQIAADAGARVINERRRGYGQAYLRGFGEARGDFIVMGDADDTYDFSDLSKLVAPLSEGADMVLGNRFSGGIASGAMPWAHRYLGSPIINLLIRLFFGTHIGDSQSGLRAFRRSAAQAMGLRSTGMEMASEMIVRAANAGLNIVEVPAPYAVRRGESKLNSLRDGWRHMRYLLLAAPDFLFTLPGTVLVLLGIVASAIALAIPAGLQIGPMSWRPVFAGTILLAIGVNATLFGVVAKRYGVSRGLLREDRWSRLYQRWFKLEIVLALAGTLFVAGLVLELLLFGAWTANTVRVDGLQQAALAQTLMIVGAELGFGSFLLVTIESP
ncbi:MAG TPA: glycosyltransferase family 2 protein [Candidatus Limnocylindria bacterium]|jgi:glycosyltransferase involved in cell wall biosynthesis|nr:glycosyltransferase family 2 protein [Candidatus Limnocylindria bacterium]